MQSPRDRFPDLSPHLSDEAIVAWETEGSCLCGCGERTSLLKGRGPGHCYFKNGHASALRKRLNLTDIHRSPKTERFYMALEQNNHDRSVAAEPIAKLLQQWLWDHQMSAWEFSRTYNFGEGILYSILRDVREGKSPRSSKGKPRRVYKELAVRILNVLENCPCHHTTKASGS